VPSRHSGEPAAPVEALGAWLRRRDDPRMLSALTRGIGDPVQAASRRHDPRHGRLTNVRSAQVRATGWVGYAPLAGVTTGRVASSHLAGPDQPATPEDDLALLADLGRAMATRLVATTTARLLQPSSERLPESLLAALEASLFGRVASTIRTLTGNSRSEVVLEVAGRGAEAVAVVGDNETVRVALPLHWVSEVWGRDLAVVGDYFALAVVEATPSSTTLRAVGSDFETSLILTVATT
jgi:hypothetical protein